MKRLLLMLAIASGSILAAANTADAHWRHGRRHGYYHVHRYYNHPVPHHHHSYVHPPYHHHHHGYAAYLPSLPHHTGYRGFSFHYSW